MKTLALTVTKLLIRFKFSKRIPITWLKYFLNGVKPQIINHHVSQGRGHRIKNVGFVSRNTHVKYQNYKGLTIQSLLIRLKFSKIGQTSR